LEFIVTDKELVEWLEKNLSRQLQWISAADSKSASIYAFGMAMLGVLATLVSSRGLNSVIEWIGAIGAGMLLLLSLLFITIATLPRRKGPKHSLIFFRGVAERTYDEFQSEVRKLTEAVLVEDYAKQCHRNAEIATAKYKWVCLSMIMLYWAILPWLPLVLVLLMRKSVS